MRPAFAEVDKQVLKESPAPRRSELERMKTKKSPDMHLAIPLPLLPRESMPSFSPRVLTPRYRLPQPTLSDGFVRRGGLGAIDGRVVDDRR